MTPGTYAALMMRTMAAGLLAGAVFDDPIDRGVLWAALIVLIVAEIVQHAHRLRWRPLVARYDGRRRQ